MNRRDFFKIFGLSIAGLVAPQWTTERNENMIGDILAKLGRRETLSSEEQNRIRIWGNQVDLNNAFLTGIKSPDGGITVNSISTRRINNEPIVKSVRVWRSTNQTIQTIPTASSTAVSFDTVLEDDSSINGFVDIGNYPTRITIPPGYGGKYILGFYVNFSALSIAGGYYPYAGGGIKLNGTGLVNVVADTEYSASGFGPIVSGSTIQNLSSGDYIELLVWQYSGNNNDIISYTNRAPVLWISKIT